MARIKVEDWLTDDSLQLLKEWASQGYTDKEIYNAIHIGKTTFYKWLNLYPQIKEAIDLGRQPVILNVEKAFISSLEDRYVNETILIEKENGKKEKRIHRKFVPAKTGAQIFYLKTHMHEKYKENKDDDSMEMIRLELQKAKKDLEIKELQIQKLKKELEKVNPEISKVDLILKEFDREAFEETE